MSDWMVLKAWSGVSAVLLVAHLNWEMYQRRRGVSIDEEERGGALIFVFAWPLVLVALALWGAGLGLWRAVTLPGWALARRCERLKAKATEAERVGRLSVEELADQIEAERAAVTKGSP